MNEWLIDNALIHQSRQGYSNICFEDGDQPDSCYIAVYCSSNGIFFPNDEENFRKRILDQDKYDWKRNRLSGVKKHIYIRDIQKQWYVEGINESLDSVNAVAMYLKQFSSKGEVFVFLGSSAGAYMACVLACILGGVAFACSPQIRLPVEEKNWLLVRYKKDPCRSDWYDIENSIRKAEAEFFILYGEKNQTDVEQVGCLADCKNTFLIPFNTAVHGVVCFPFTVSSFIKNRNVLKGIAESGKKQNRLLFAAEMMGWKTTMKLCARSLKEKRRR